MTTSPTQFDCLINHVLHGDALRQLQVLPDGLVDTIVTSPPYYYQRDYSGEHQLGLEETPEAYIGRLATVFRECRRTLKDSGSLWLVLGDKYLDGEQLGMPWRVALALKADGWILRSDIIWHKPNAMPSAVKTRPTTDHEYVFRRGETPVATVSKQWFSWTDTYGVDINDGEDDVLLLVSAVVVDMACHDNRKQQ